MISLLLYGRNDSYGYNLHKRAALSLNCMAEILDDPDDEILFVDYNTPDDLPTFPEAIRDTLTPRARARLRILRVRPAQHRRFAARTHLVALEPVARNVALRRSNPCNRWILSTNTDMVFVPAAGHSLSALAAALPDGFHHLPRFEIPETLWEMLDRSDPAATIATIARWGSRYHLDEIVTLDDPAIRFDGPGDFQLMLRQDLHDIAGFDERMLLGWHVDSNIATRLALLRGAPGDLIGSLRGYHCDHTRQVTPAHRSGAPQNDWSTFVTDIAAPLAPGQPGWGLDGETVEEVRLDADCRYLAALDLAVPGAMAHPTTARLHHGPAAYEPGHVAPFVLDALCTSPPGTTLAWVASTPALLDRIAPAWAALGHSPPLAAIATGGPVPSPDAVADLVARADLLVFDFALDGAVADQGAMLAAPPLAAVADAFLAAAMAERSRMATAAPRRFVTVNTICNDAGLLVEQHLGAALAPFSTRLRQGFVRPLRPALNPAAIGIPDGERIRIPLGRIGQAATCTYPHLPAGQWRAVVTLAPGRPLGMPGPLKLEAVRNGAPLAHRYAIAAGLLPQTLAFPFAVPNDATRADTTIRLHTIGLAACTIAAMRIVPRA